MDKLTIKELRILVDEEINDMSEHEEYCRTIHNDPTFLQMVLSDMEFRKSRLVEINEVSYTYNLLDLKTKKEAKKILDL